MRAHKRVVSLSPTRSPSRQRITDDILSDLSPTTTLEAFTNPSGKLRASVEAASPAERAFGIRATLASKKIQEWADELSTWAWPAEAGSAGFEIPAEKRRRLSFDERMMRAGRQASGEVQQYIGSLSAEEVARYENRIDDIHEDMEDLNVEEIKSTVLNTHFSPRSRPSSSGSNASVQLMLSNYTRMDDFTAVVTATVLQALPYLSRLMRWMDVWIVRLLVLRKVPLLLQSLDDAEVALKSGWQAIEDSGAIQDGTSSQEDNVFERNTFEDMRDVLQNKVTSLGKQLDLMLDTLEGRQDTLPDVWLNRMETIERDFGEWVVSGDRKVRAGEWSRIVEARKAEGDPVKAQYEALQAAGLKAEQKQWENDKRLSLEQKTEFRQEWEGKEAREKLRLDQETAAEVARQSGLSRALQKERSIVKGIACQHSERSGVENGDRLKSEQEASADSARKAKHERRQEEAIRGEAERSRLDNEARTKLEQEAVIELSQELGKDQSGAKHATHGGIEIVRVESLERLSLMAKAEACSSTHAKLARKQDKTLQQEESHDADLPVATPLPGKDASVKKEAKIAPKDMEFAKNQHVESFAGPKTIESDLASALNLVSPDAAPHLISSASPSALEARAAIAVNFLRSIIHKDAKSEDSVHEAATTASASINILSSSISLPYEEAERTNPPYTTHEPLLSATSPMSTYNLFPSFTSDFAALDLRENTNMAGLKPISRIAFQPAEDDSISRTLNKTGIATSSVSGPPTSQCVEIPNVASQHEEIFSQQMRSALCGTLQSAAVSSPLPKPMDGLLLAGEGGNPTSQPEPARFTDGLPILQLPASSQNMADTQKSRPLGSQANFSSSQIKDPAKDTPKTPKEADILSSFPPSFMPTNMTNSLLPLTLQSPARERIDQEWILVESEHGDNDQGQSFAQNRDVETLDTDDTSGYEAQNIDISMLNGHSTSDATPEIQKVETAEYFRRIKHPFRIAPNTSRQSSSTTKLFLPDSEGMVEDLSSLDEAEPSSIVPAKLREKGPEASAATLVGLLPELVRLSELDKGWEAGLQIAPRTKEHATQIGNLRESFTARTKSPIQETDVPQRSSTGSDTSIAPSRQASEDPSSPSTLGYALSPSAMADELPDVKEGPSLKGQVRLRIHPPSDRNISYSSSPSPVTSPRSPSHLHDLPSFGKVEEDSSGLAVTRNYAEAPILDNVDVSEASLLSNPKKTSDDQIQAQIFSLLETIPTRIHLTSEPNMLPSPPPDTLRPAKNRRSATPSSRPHSSFSTRALTPSLTLAPAYGKGNSRARPQNSNPEIKLYHLSRGTGEVPIKLFVRLVGENGERVMVRVGGGWADLGEYLREYASHHGRRSTVNSDRVEVQDIRLRVVSADSTFSSAGIRGNGQSSPASRPGSAMDRPSLNIRRTRRTVAEKDTNHMTVRTPSTPNPTANRGKDFVTPPSEKSRSSSRLSWTEEEGGLGLAGPMARKFAISERDQEWVESMKEKVRLASAEKEKWEAKDRERKSFGEIDKVGVTKRLFKKW